ncbi:MAG: Gfo/Idh/MocA family oxidoreductase [Chloroflexi bacterium]|nr:Gfo/Idh/MocA family oxidoreductase [Chloroflexota bacterium]
MANKKLRVGIIGANVNYGWGPRAHLPALVALPDIDLVAVCTAHEDTARESAERYGVPAAFHDHMEMLKQDDIDAVGVIVRVPLHHRLTMDVVAAGKHVFTEWPLGANLAEAEEMAELARKQNVHTMVGLQARCSPAILRLKELIEQGYVGEVVSSHMALFGSGVLTRTSGRTWQRERVLGANTLTISFGHAIDALCMCLGEFKEVSSVVTTQIPQWHETDTDRMVDVTSPDNILISGVLESGAVVSAHVSSIPWHGSGFRLEVYGREGTLTLEGSGGAQIESIRLRGGKGKDDSLEDLEVPPHHSWVSEEIPQGPPYNVAQMWSRFADAIAGGTRAEPDFDTAVQRQRMLAAIEMASETGQRQTL